MKFFTKEVKIALVAITGVVLLFFGMNFLKGLNLFSSSTDYYVEFVCLRQATYMWADIR